MDDLDYEEISRRPLLAAQEEGALIQSLRAGDAAARTQLVEAYLRLVLNIAKTYCRAAARANVPFESLFQAGREGLVLAIDRFDPSKGFRLSTYATHWIRQGIGRRLDRQKGTVESPLDRTRLRLKVQQVRQRLWEVEGAYPTIERLADVFGLPPRVLRGAFREDDEETLRLLPLVKDGDDDATARLLERYGELVERIAREVHQRFWSRVPFEDLVHTGEAGLLQAAQRFDPDEGFSFSTYATHWIRQAVLGRLPKA